MEVFFFVGCCVDDGVVCNVEIELLNVQDDVSKIIFVFECIATFERSVSKLN